MNSKSIGFIVLVLAHLVLPWFAPALPPLPSKAELSDRIQALEKAAQTQQLIAHQREKALAHLQDAPRISADVYVAKLRETAGNQGVYISELAATPTSFHLKGTGIYRSFAAILQECAGSLGVLVTACRWERLADGRLKLDVRAAIQQGDWSVTPGIQKIPEAVVLRSAPSLGLVDLPNVTVAKIAPVRTRATPKVKYLGYYKGPNGATVILEENMRAVLLRVGDKLSGDLIIQAADEKQLEMRDERGNTWQVPMQGKR